MKPAYLKTATRALFATTLVATLAVYGCNERNNTTTNNDAGGTDVNTTDSATIMPDSMTTMMDTSLQMMDTASQAGTQ